MPRVLPSNPMHTPIRSASHGLFLATLLVMASCAATRRAKSVERSGFLAPDVELRAGVGEEPLLVFEHPAKSLAGYDAVLIDPVQVWYGDAAKRSGTSQEDLERLAVLLHDSMRVALESDFKIVREPGPTTLRVRVALTDADAARPIGNTITTFIPQARRLSVIGGKFTNVRVWTGAASVEGEVLDSITGERLMAAIDRRVGTKSPAGAWERWDDVEQAFEFWAHRVRRRMQGLGAEAGGREQEELPPPNQLDSAPGESPSSRP